MNDENGVCLRRAHELVQAVGLSPDLVKRENKFRQQGSDSAWRVMHYCELEVMNQALEGWGACKPVSKTRKTQMRTCVNTAVAQVNEARYT